MSKSSNYLGLAHICIYTKNQEESVRFYTEVLDFDVVYRTVVNPDQEPDGFFPLQYVLVQRGSCRIELLQPSNTESVKTNISGSVEHFALQVRDIELALTELKAKGYAKQDDQAISLPNLFNGARAYFIKGPSGESIELFEFTE